MTVTSIYAWYIPKGMASKENSKDGTFLNIHASDDQSKTVRATLLSLARIGSATGIRSNHGQ